MPLDPRIALGYEPVKTIPLADLLKTRIGLQAAQQQIGLNQQQRDLNVERIAQERQLARRTELENAAKEQSQRSQDAYLQAMADTNGEPDKMEQVLKNAPLTPEHRIAANNQIAQERERRAKATKEQTAQEVADKDTYGQGLRSIRALPEDQKLPAWQALIQDAAGKKSPVSGTPYITPGQVDPNTVPSNDQLTAMERLLRGTTNFEKSNKEEETARKTAAADAAKRLSDLHTEASSVFQGITKAEDYEKALADFAAIDDDHRIYAKRFLTVMPTGTPEALKSSLTTINRRALKPEERQRADDAAANRTARRQTGLEIGIERAKAELGEDAAEADILALGQKYYAETERAKKLGAGKGGGTAAKDDRGFTPTQVRADQKEHEKLQAGENQAWRLAQDYDAILKMPDGAMVTDPSSKSLAARPLDSDLRTNFRRRLDDARAKATDLQSQKKLIREKHGWDTTPAAAAGGGAAPAATPPATVAKPVVTGPVADPSIQEKGGYKVDGEYETKDGRKFTLKGFTKDGKMIPQFK